MTDTDTLNDDEAEEVAPSPEQLQALIAAASSMPIERELSIHQCTFRLDVFRGHLHAMACLGEVQREAGAYDLRALLAVGAVRYTVAYLGKVETVEESTVVRRAVWPDETALAATS